MNIALLGSKEACLRAANALVKIADSNFKLIIVPNDLHDKRNAYNEIVTKAKKHNVPVEMIDNSDQLTYLLRSYEIDLAIIANWYKLINVNKTPSTKFYGFHNSLLPEYRGNAPLVWQIIKGEKVLGVTMFEITEGMDEGDIIGQSSFEFSERDEISNALDKIHHALEELIIKNVPLLINGNEKRIQQDHSEASYCGMRIPEDGAIDWNQSAIDVHNFIRAQSPPYPGAYSYLNDKKVTILKSVLDSREIFAVPGSVVERHNDYVVVGCAENAVQIHKISVDGDNSIKPRDLFSSLKNRLKRK